MNTLIVRDNLYYYNLVKEYVKHNKDDLFTSSTSNDNSPDELYNAITNNNIINIVSILTKLLYALFERGVECGFELKSIYGNYNMKKMFYYKHNFPVMNIEVNTKLMELINVYQTEEKNQTIKTWNLKFNKTNETYKSSPKYEEDRLNLEKMLQNIIDYIYVISEQYKLNINYAFVMLHESNMSKFCHSIEEVDATIKYYKDDKDLIYRKINELYFVSNSKSVLNSVNYKEFNINDIISYYDS